jgi:Zn-dependent membrane protease YugP
METLYKYLLAFFTIFTAGILTMILWKENIGLWIITVAICFGLLTFPEYVAEWDRERRNRRLQ